MTASTSVLLSKNIIFNICEIFFIRGVERKIKSNYFLGEKQGVFTTEVSIFKMRSCI